MVCKEGDLVSVGCLVHVEGLVYDEDLNPYEISSYGGFGPCGGIWSMSRPKVLVEGFRGSYGESRLFTVLFGDSYVTHMEESGMFCYLWSRLNSQFLWINSS